MDSCRRSEGQRITLEEFHFPCIGFFHSYGCQVPMRRANRQLFVGGFQVQAFTDQLVGVLSVEVLVQGVMHFVSLGGR